METSKVIQALDAQIARLQKAKALLSGGAGAKRGPVTAKPAAATSFTFGKNVAPKPRRRKRRKMSAEGRARIVAAQKARWAKVKAKR